MIAAGNLCAPCCRLGRRARPEADAEEDDTRLPIGRSKSHPVAPRQCAKHLWLHRGVHRSQPDGSRTDIALADAKRAEQAGFEPVAPPGWMRVSGFS